MAGRINYQPLVGIAFPVLACVVKRGEIVEMPLNP